MNLMMKYQSRLQRSLLREEELKVIIPDTQGTPMEITNPNPSSKTVMPGEHPSPIGQSPHSEEIPAAKVLDPDLRDGIQHSEHPKIAVTEKSSENELLWGTAESTTPNENIHTGANVEVKQDPFPQGAPATQQKRKSGKAKQQKEPEEKAKLPPPIQGIFDLGDTMRSGTTKNYGPV